MNLKQTVIAKRNKTAIVISFISSGLFFFLFLVMLLTADLKSMSNDEIGGIIIFGFLPIFLFMFSLIFALATPKNMIIFDKDKKEFCLHCGKSLAEINEPVYISVHDIISVNYEKYRVRYFVILITIRPSYIDIKLKNGKKYTVYNITKPEDAKFNLQRILLNYNKPEEE